MCFSNQQPFLEQFLGEEGGTLPRLPTIRKNETSTCCGNFNDRVITVTGGSVLDLVSRIPSCERVWGNQSRSFSTFALKFGRLAATFSNFSLCGEALLTPSCFRFEDVRFLLGRGGPNQVAKGDSQCQRFRCLKIVLYFSHCSSTYFVQLFIFHCVFSKAVLILVATCAHIWLGGSPLSLVSSWHCVNLFSCVGAQAGLFSI